MTVGAAVRNRLPQRFTLQSKSPMHGRVHGLQPLKSKFYL